MTDPNEQDMLGPPTAGDEVATLLGSLERQRATFAWKVGGLDEKGLAAKVGASALTLGGLIKHLAFVEDLKFTTMLLGEDLVAPWNAVDWENDAGWPWHSAAEDSPAALYRLWHDAVGRSRASVARAIPKAAWTYGSSTGSVTTRTTHSVSGGCSWTSSRSTRGTSVTPT